MEAKDIRQVEQFVLECNDMLSGKFFDIDKRLEKFLSKMAASDDVIDLLAECLANFDEEAEFSRAFSTDRKSGATVVALPTEDKKRLALSVAIFNNLTNGKISSNQFLETYFQDEKITPIQGFLEKIILPFRDLICKSFAISPNITAADSKKAMDFAKKEEPKTPEEPEEKEEFPHLGELMAELEKTCNQVLALLKFEKKRTDVLDDVEFVTNSILKACERGDLMVVNGLVVGLNYVSKKFKNVRHLVEDMNSAIYDYYEFLAGSMGQPNAAEEDLGEEA